MRKTSAITVYLYPDELEIALELREDRHVSVGHYVEEVIRDHLRAAKVRMAQEEEE
jgi:citrate lyase gamma subunit